jgi:hypothetical protein
VTPVSQITLPVTFGTRENFHTENLQFEVANFETAYNAFLGWPTLQVYGNPTLCLLGPKDARTMSCHLHQGRRQAGL